jgi:hypothetical protein
MNEIEFTKIGAPEQRRARKRMAVARGFDCSVAVI